MLSLVCNLIGVAFLPLLASANSQSFTTQSDFQAGTADANTETNQSPGDVKLKQNKNTYTETTKADFDQGHSGAKDTMTTQTDDGEVALVSGSSWMYSEATTPAIGNAIVRTSFVDASRNLLYVSVDTGGGTSSSTAGLYVINTQGTIDPSDDTLVIRYANTSTPNIGTAGANAAFLDDAHNLLYICTRSSGLSVINTQGTVDPSDDILVKTYTTATTPAIGSNGVFNIFIDTDNNLLYVSTGAGLSVINTHGTIDPADDTLVKTYTTATTPALVNNTVISAFVDTAKHLIYVGTYSGGISVINTQGTIDPSDDTLVTTYTTATTPAIGGNRVRHMFLDTTTHLLYVSADNGGLSVIDTKDTVSGADDTLVITYNSSSTPAIGGGNAMDSFLNNATHLLYVADGNGVSVIDTKGTVDPIDDTLVRTYTDTSSPSLGNSWSHSLFFDAVHNLLYVSEYGGILSVLDLNEEYNPTGSFTSQSLEIANTPTSAISFSPTLPIGTSASIQTRTGGSDVVWVDNFNDNSTSEYVGDFYGWGCPFDNAIESNGTMKLSGTSNVCGNSADTWTNEWIDTGKPDEYFPAGSVITAKIKINSNRQWAYNDTIFTDQWNDSISDWKNNEWMTLKFTATSSFSKIGLETDWVGGTWNNATDSLEIDWLKIELPDTNPAWGAWSTSCTNQYGCPAADTTGKAWLQYKLNLATDNTAVTPAVNSVTLTSGYPDSGMFTSQVIDATRTADWQTFSTEQTLPLGTSITYQTRSGQTPTPDNSWSAWQATTDSNIDSANSRYLQFQATLATTDENQTPVLSALTISYELTQQKIIPDPTIEKLAEAFSQGFITIAGNDPTNTNSFTFVVDTILTTENSSITFPANTQVTNTQGGTLDLTQLTTTLTTALIQAQLENILGAIQIGIPNLNLTFSQPITITFPVGTKYNGTTLEVIFQREDETTWNDETTCNVTDGDCIFITNHATSFAAVHTKNQEEDTSRDLNIHKVASSATSNSITLTWKTDYATQDTVRYGINKNLENKQKDNQKEKSHKLTLNNLSPNTNYYFKIKSEDGKDNKDSSSVHMVKTQPSGTQRVETQHVASLPGAKVSSTAKPATDQRNATENSIPPEKTPEPVPAVQLQPQSQTQNPSSVQGSSVWWKPWTWF